jgi:hypothetical protein
VQLVIDTDGTVRTLYTEAIDLQALGPADIRRASHVEPFRWEDGCVVWTADMSPVGGPVLGPFAKRSEALAAEVCWLEENVL